MPRNSYLPSCHAWQRDLVNLCRTGRYTDAAIARELTKHHPPLVFTRRMVIYHRVELVEKQGGRLGEDCATLAESRRNGRRAYQVRKGLADLLPDYVEPVPGRWVTITDPATGRPVRVWAPLQHGGYGAGHELTPREADLLALLRESGPLSRKEIARRMGTTLQNICLEGRPFLRLLGKSLLRALPGRLPLYTPVPAG